MLHCAVRGSGDPQLGELLSGEGEVTVHILAHYRLLVGAGHVVPLDPVPVVVVEHGETGLGVPAQLLLLPVVGLLARRPPPPGVGPGVEPRPIGRRHRHLRGRPEPPVYVLGEKVGPVAALKIAESARSPEVGNGG